MIYNNLCWKLKKNGKWQIIRKNERIQKCNK